jgi:peptidoglycan/LPS O-acetylase OafA/YrhL
MGRLGEYSYSIYLLHFFVVFEMARIIDQHLMAIGNFYLACLWSALCFLCMLPIGYLSFRFIEAPFLRHRRLYALSKSSR